MTPYQRIMRAALEGRGLRLSAREVIGMAGDYAISALAEGDDRIAAIRRVEKRDEVSKRLEGKKKS